MKYFIAAFIALCLTFGLCGYMDGQIQQRGKYDALVRNSDCNGRGGLEHCIN